MSTLKGREREIVAEFTAYDDWMDKYQYLVELGNELEPLEDEEKNDTTLIKGCQSQVWLVCDEKDGKIYYRGDSDAIIVKGVVSLLIKVLSGSLPDEIIDFDFGFVDEIGLKEHLSPTRSNGLVAMMHQMRFYAMAFKVSPGLLK